ncbi:MAG: Gfo/Idh/MocA family oxidoreductase [Lapillicoccus sp.]
MSAAVRGDRDRAPTRGIGLIGCGWVASMQLAAYRDAGFSVVALTDHTPAKAEQLRDAYYPDAVVHPDVGSLLADAAVQVVAIATHPSGRPALVEQALLAGRDVLSQKPFVEHLDEGERLCDLADRLGRTLAVDANGRWAPHFAALVDAVDTGRVGAITSADFWVYWPHDAVVEGMPAFVGMEDLVLYDFGIHWFDLVGALVPGAARAVSAQVGRRPGQRISAPTQAQVVVEYDGAQVSLRFRAAERRAERGGYRVDGVRGSVLHEGTSLGGPQVVVVTGEGDDESDHVIEVTTDWFRPGFTGTMAELLTALDQGRTPTNTARSALPGLALCFAAVEAARTGHPVVPGAVRRRPGTVDRLTTGPRPTP